METNRTFQVMSKPDMQGQKEIDISNIKGFDIKLTECADTQAHEFFNNTIQSIEDLIPNDKELHSDDPVLVFAGSISPGSTTNAACKCECGGTSSCGGGGGGHVL